MKRGKRVLENDKLVIYVGTVIFFLLAIALGTIMYMLNKTATKLENNSSQVYQESQINEDYESASTEIGKSVEEQEKSEEKKSTELDVNNAEDVEDVSIENKKATNDVKTSNVIDTTLPKSDNISNDTNTENSKKSNETINDNSMEVKKEITFIKPTDGDIICEYAKDNLIYSETLKEWITHTAIDIKADKTSVVKASADGIVKSIVNDPRYGLTVVIEHADGYQTVYSNLLTAEFVVVGEEVAQGQTIGTAGNTASFESSMESHIHFEMVKDGEYLDPSIYLK